MFSQFQNVESTQSTLDKSSKLTAHSVQSPTLVANCLNNSKIANKNETVNKNEENSITSHSDSNKTKTIAEQKSIDYKIDETEDVSKPVLPPKEKNDFKNSNIDTQNCKVIDNDVENRDVGLELRENNYAFHEDNDNYREYEDEDGMSYEEAEENYGGGIRERSLLCPILEEDGESTASTSSLITSSLSGASSRVSLFATTNMI